MEVKKIALGILVTAACAAPVLAQGLHGRGGGVSVPNHGNGVLASGFVCDKGSEDFFDDGGFARWVTGHVTTGGGAHSGVHGGVHGSTTSTTEFTFGTTDGDGQMFGLQLLPTGLPAKTFGVDWNFNNSNSTDPAFAIFINDGDGIIRSRFISAYNAGPSTGFTVTQLGNGFTRFLYNAVSDFGSGNRWSNIYIYDSDGEGFNDETLVNVNLNGATVNHGIVPNITATPVLDCTPPFDIYGCD